MFNTFSFVRAIAEPRKKSILPIKQASLEHIDSQLSVQSKQGENYLFHYQKIIFMAGEGNEYLLSRFSCDAPVRQRRPLKMVVMRGVQNDMIYAHCLGASVNPRITITSHRDTEGAIVWYMGGQLAEEGVNKNDAELVQATKDELSDLIPWLELEHAQWGVLKINRAEIKKPGTTRPDSFSIEESNNVITAWPTKMALAPALADVVLAKMNNENIVPGTDLSMPGWAEPEYADFPWNEAEFWSSQ